MLYYLPLFCRRHGHPLPVHFFIVKKNGISPLSDDRADEAIEYFSQLCVEMPKREDRPDRVYGLQVTDTRLDYCT